MKHSIFFYLSTGGFGGGFSLRNALSRNISPRKAEPEPLLIGYPVPVHSSMSMGMDWW